MCNCVPAKKSLNSSTCIVLSTLVMSVSSSRWAWFANACSKPFSLRASTWSTIWRSSSSSGESVVSISVTISIKKNSVRPVAYTTKIRNYKFCKRHLLPMTMSRKIKMEKKVKNTIMKRSFYYNTSALLLTIRRYCNFPNYCTWSRNSLVWFQGGGCCSGGGRFPFLFTPLLGPNHRRGLHLFPDFLWFGFLV